LIQRSSCIKICLFDIYYGIFCGGCIDIEGRSLESIGIVVKHWTALFFVFGQVSIVYVYSTSKSSTRKYLL